MRLIIECKGQKREYLLREGSTVVGRDPSCDIVFPDASLSRRHVECRLKAGELVVRDLNTKNGTFLGPQRVQEAHLPAGVRLRAGNVFLHFEPDTAPGSGGTVIYPPSRAARAPVEAAPSVASADELAQAVPPAANYEQDETPTPLESEPVAAADAPAAGDSARLVVRDGRWYVQDPATGAEVEIVPRQGEGTALPLSGAPTVTAVSVAPRPVVQRMPAAPAGPEQSARRRRIFLYGFAAVFMVLLAVVVILATHKKPPAAPLLSAAQFRDEVNQAVLLFQGGERDEAREKIRKLITTPAAVRPDLAKMLFQAFEADAAAVKDFKQNWEAARRQWEEVRKYSGSTPQAVELARTRFAWLNDESLNMAHVNDARDLLKQGKYIAAMQRAGQVPDGSMFKPETESIIQEAIASVRRDANLAGEQENWVEAIRIGEIILKAKPDAAGDLEGKIRQWRQNEADRLNLDKARQAAAQNANAEVLALVKQIGAKSPYFGQAQALERGVLQKAAVQMAVSAYNAGNGEQALDLLAKAGSPDPQLAAKVQAVMKSLAKAQEELKLAHYLEARSEVENILRLEKPQENRYAQDAKRILDGLPGVIKKAAQDLVTEAGTHRTNHEFRDARSKFEKALQLDPANQDAREGLKELAASALRDYNLYLNMMVTDPDKALEGLKGVRDRIPASDPLYPKVENDIYNLTQKQKQK